MIWIENQILGTITDDLEGSFDLTHIAKGQDVE